MQVDVLRVEVEVEIEVGQSQGPVRDQLGEGDRWEMGDEGGHRALSEERADPGECYGDRRGERDIRAKKNLVDA